MFDKDYVDILKIVKSWLRNNFFIEATDIIAIAFCQYNKASEYQRVDFLKRCKVVFLAEKRRFEQQDKCLYSDAAGAEHTCSKCKKTLHVSKFGLTYGKALNVKKVCSYCIDCNREHVKQYYDKKKADPTFIKKRKEMQKKIKLKSVTYLEDNYVITILAKNYPREYIWAHPELIVEKRKQLYEKRQKVKLVKIDKRKEKRKKWEEIQHQKTLGFGVLKTLVQGN